MSTKDKKVDTTETSSQVAIGDMANLSHKICYTRYNSPFWQVVIVSFVAFGWVFRVQELLVTLS